MVADWGCICSCCISACCCDYNNDFLSFATNDINTFVMASLWSSVDKTSIIMASFRWYWASVWSKLTKFTETFNFWVIQKFSVLPLLFFLFNYFDEINLSILYVICLMTSGRGLIFLVAYSGLLLRLECWFSFVGNKRLYHLGHGFVSIFGW